MANIKKLMQDAMRHAAQGNTPVIPEGGRLAWRWFLDLCRTRTSNGYGSNPISHGEIEAYARLYRWPLEPRHVDMILALDRVWLETARPGEVHSGGTNTTPRNNAQAINPNAFDAVFG